MKLYFTKGACSLAVRIIINELKLKVEYIAVDLKTKKTAAGHDFMQINPKGSVPVLAIDSKTILTENAVILQYLADTNQRNQLLPKVGELSRYRTLEWLNFITTELHKGIGVMFNPKVTAAMRDDFFIPLVTQKLNFVNQSIGKQKYLLGKHFTLPDAYLFVILRWALYFKINLPENLTNYYQHLQNYPAVAQSLQQEELE